MNAMTIAKYRPNGATIPFNELINELFGHDIGQMLGQDDARRNVPAANIVERENEFELRLFAPGFSKEDLKLNVEEGTLTISADHKKEQLKENERFTRHEFLQHSFSRGFRLPQTTNAEGISAEYTNGVLHVRIPKAVVEKPKARSISIG